MRNIISDEPFVTEFVQVCTAINVAPIRCVIITGRGRAFSARENLRTMRAKEGMFAGTGLDVAAAYRRGV